MYLKNYFLCIPSYLIAAAAPIAAKLAELKDEFYPGVIVVIVMSLMYILGLSVFHHEKSKFTDSAQAYVLCAYVIAGFTSIVLISMLENAKLIYPMVFIGSFVTDTFCYFSGYFFGKHKLAPVISPKKTIEGSVGGTLICVICFLIYGYVVSVFTELTPNYIALGITGFVLAIVSQIGDLAMSAIKREFGIKDYGKLFPGHGGVMDRFDSFIAVSAFLALIGTQMQISLFN